MLRPALAAEGIDSGAVGLVRSPDRSGAEALVSLPRWIPLVILRGSGASTAALERLASDNRVRTLAHAEGGGVLYVHGSARADRVTAIVDSSLDRLGVCNRLNLALVDREAADLAAGLVAACEGRGVEVVGTPRATAVVGVRELDERIGYEWASDPARVATVTLDIVDDLPEAVQIANTETSALAAGIVAEDVDAVERFFSLYRGSAAFWHASTRYTDGFELTGSPETGINVDWAPGPRGPVTYRDLWLRQYRVVGDATQAR